MMDREFFLVIRMFLRIGVGVKFGVSASSAEDSESFTL